MTLPVPHYVQLVCSSIVVWIIWIVCKLYKKCGVVWRDGGLRPAGAPTGSHKPKPVFQHPARETHHTQRPLLKDFILIIWMIL